MEDTIKKARNYAWKCFAVLSVGAVIHLIVSFKGSLRRTNDFQMKYYGF